jgi:hypothetical protein
MTAWTEPGADPFADINRAMQLCWYGTTGQVAPNTLLMPLRVYIRLRRPMMTKRGFRRWRAKTLARSRQLER